MNLQTALRQASHQLKNSPSPDLDAEVLLAHVLSPPPSSPSRKAKGEVGRGWLFANPKRKLTKLQATTYKLLTRKRCNRWPVAYLTGHREFFGLDFLVNPDVLIPRPETELLVERAIQAISDQRLAIRNVVDIGTGSGNIIISIAKPLPSVILRIRQLAETKNLTTSRKRSFAVAQDDTEVKFFAIDSSTKALIVARRNARRHGVSSKIKFLHGNLLEPFLQATSYKLPPTLILANLPYLTPAQYRANRDLRHEPRSALVGGPDGLKYFRELFKQLSVILRSEATKNLGVSKKRSFARLRRAQDDRQITVLLEHDPSQKEKLKRFIKIYFPKTKVKFYKDLAGQYRICTFTF